MKKKIVCLVCALVLLLTPVLSACQKLNTEGDLTGEVLETASESTITLSMYVVSEEQVSEETAKQVNDAINAFTKSKFKTQIVLHYLTYDKYYETISSLIEGNDAYRALSQEAADAFKKAKKDAKADGVATDKLWEDSWYEAHPEYIEFRETEPLTGEDTTAEETVMMTVEGADGYQISQLKYPDERQYQLDILWIDSYDRYKEFIANEWIERLDDELTGASKKLKEYIAPSLLSWVKWSSQGTYAIPNNCTIGEYTYLLLNKKYVDKYHHTSNVSKISNIFDDAFKNYLADVAAYEKDVVPISGDIPLTNVTYWNLVQTTASSAYVDTKKFNIMGDFYGKDRTLNPDSTDNAPLAGRNLFTSDNDYVKQLRAIQSYKDAQYIVSEDATGDKAFAAKVVKGGYELQEQYGEDYYMVVLEQPRISEENLFSSMFAVSSFTRSLSRSMEVITCLNTNSDLRNLLQYGIKGIHYKVNDDGCAERIPNDKGTYDYVMDLKKTGNLFMAYPEAGMDPNVWTYAKKQNLDALPGLLNCFRLTADNLVKDPTAEEQSLINMEQIEKINAASEKLEKALAAVTSLDELDELIAKVGTAEYEADNVKLQISNGLPTAFYYVYLNEWLQEVQLYVPASE